MPRLRYFRLDGEDGPPGLAKIEDVPDEVEKVLAAFRRIGLQPTEIDAKAARKVGAAQRRDEDQQFKKEREA